MRHLLLAILLTVLPFGQLWAAETRPDVETLEAELLETEKAFSKSAEDRDLKAFRSFLTPGTVFSSPHGNRRGPDAIVEQWAGFFAEDGPSIRWRPSRSAVVEDGGTGLTTGPFWVEGVGPDGEPFAMTGTFFSVWQRDESGAWKIVLDTGTEAVPVTEKED